MTRRGCVLGLLAWLCVMSLPVVAFLLAMRGELAWRRGEFVEDRLWLVRDPQANGLAYSASRIVSDQRPVDGPVCVRTQVTFLLWQGRSEALGFCECFGLSPLTGTYEPAGECS